MSFFSWLRNRTSIRSPRGRAQLRPSAPRFRPQLEALEDRCVPSTLKVTNLADSGPGSLRYEIAQAQSNDTIVFDFGGKKTNSTPHTITLSSGELDINKNLTIQGPGAGLLTVASPGHASSGSLYDGSSRIFEVESFVNNATLSGMTISNGVGLKSSYNPYAPYGTSGDYYDGTGGGVLNLGKLTISGCTLSNNFASFSRASGGGIANLGTLTITNCTLSNNEAFGNGGGIYNSGNCTLTVSGGALSGNTADNGGGIYSDLRGTLTVSGCTLSGNTAWGDGSGANDGHAIEYGYGGGICNYGGTATVTGCTLSGNSAHSGGGIWNGGTLTVSNNMFSSNSPDNIFGPYTDGGGNTFS
jgi:hypothetical protein